jgi:chromosome transmission fidelity protein 4
MVYFAFENGTFMVSSESEFVIQSEAPKVVETEETASPAEESAHLRSNHNTGRGHDQGNTRTGAGDASDDDDIDFEDSETKVKKKSASFVDDEADEDDNDGPSAEPADLADALLDQEEENVDDASEDDPAFDAPHRSNRSLIMLPEPQPAFSPSSTPLDLPRRIMCWNHIGTITLLRGDDDVARNTIAIDFTDSGFMRPITFTDNLDFIIGSLGEDGAFFATDLADDHDDALDDDVDEIVHGLKMSDKTKAALRKSQKQRMKKRKEGFKSSGSSVYFHRFETFGKLSNKDWVVALPDGELAMGCATGEGWAACITNRRFLRTFSAGGNQGPVIWMKGDPVTIVGRSRFVAVFYHEAMPLPDGTQKLGYAIYDAISAEEIVIGSLSCISSRSSLSWVGFSKEGSLMVMDSDGMLSMLSVLVAGMGANINGKQFSWSWSPMLDTVGLRKSFEDSFWPVSVQDGKLICVPLKGGNQYPDAARRPVTSALSLRMPFAYGADKR